LEAVAQALVADDNQEALEAWNGVLFDRFVEFRHLVADGLAPHGRAGMRILPPRLGDHVLDIGCGFGDSSLELAELVGPTGSVLGVDVAPRFIETAQVEAAAAGVPNVRFEVRDVQASPFTERFDYAFSRFGTMFFANPVAALRNVRSAIEPGGGLCMVVWRRKLDNPWLHRAELIVKPLVPEPEEPQGPRCGPGPFFMADADTTGEILVSSGFEEIAFHRSDLPIRLGTDLDEAVASNMAIGPAAEAVRLAGPDVDSIRPQLEGLLREGLAEFVTPDGVFAASSTWVVTARVPHS
jgi:SAM-dependent methyltransferase